jgi:hypothetical protein
MDSEAQANTILGLALAKVIFGAGKATPRLGKEHHYISRLGSGFG